MTRQELIDFCLTFPAAYEDYPFDDIVDAGAWTRSTGIMSCSMRMFYKEKEMGMIGLSSGLAKPKVRKREYCEETPKDTGSWIRCKVRCAVTLLYPKLLISIALSC